MRAIWTGEHHGMEFTIAPNPFITITDLARHTKNVRLSSRASLSHVDVPLPLWSTANSISFMTSPFFILKAPSHAATQTQRMFSSTSHMPFGRTPPQGPLRIVFGQFMGQLIPVFESAQSPHILQSKRNPLRPASAAVMGLSNFLPKTLVTPRSTLMMAGFTVLYSPSMKREWRTDHKRTLYKVQPFF